ncbi:MAG: hypothetical protein DME18_00635 [Verrucomicrobia bacterium]|nr:MAG: hypothetical protein DME18_00635 [Verrucomicrobiota bacterium]
MKFLAPIAGCCFALARMVSAQVTVELALEQDQFLPGETLEVGVRITNFSGQTLHLGKDNDWLHFTIEGRDNYIVPTSGDVPVQGEFEVDSSSVATRRVDVAPYFTLTRPGRYLVTATVKLKQWDKELVCKPRPFHVIAGTKLWEQEFGVPNAAGQPPEVRKYALQQAIHLKQMKLYARVTDQSESRVFRIFPIGPMISFSKPECQIDKSNNLHVLNQTGAKSFNYSVINADGRLLVRQTYEYSDTRPVLRVDPQGRIFIGGGARRVASDDLPTPPDSSSTNEAATPKP